MKTLLSSLLLFCSLTISAQVDVVTRQNMQQTTTTTRSNTSQTATVTKPHHQQPTTVTKPNHQTGKRPSGNTNKPYVSRKGQPVYTGAQLIDAIGSNKTILISKKINITSDLRSYINSGRIYLLPNWDSQPSRPGVYARKLYEEYELLIYGIDNLSILGTSNQSSQILTEYAAAEVLNFKNCDNVTISNLTFGHLVPTGGCDGGVLYFSDSNRITINSCDLFGCGVLGISAFGTNNITVNNTAIRDCSDATLWLSDCQNISFSSCSFLRNRGGDWIGQIQVSKSGNVKFTNCVFSKNQGELFNCDCYISLKKCSINHSKSNMGTMNYVTQY